MKTANIIQGLNRLADLRKQAQDKRYKLLAECCRLEALIIGQPHTAQTFEDSMKYLETCENDLLEAKIHAYNQSLHDQFEASRAPVRELNPHND